MTRPLTLAGGRSPHAIFLLAAGLISGAAYLFDVTPAPRTIDSLLPEQIRIVWTGFLFLGSLVSLVGLAWPRDLVRRMVTGLLIERAGMLAAGPAALIYGTGLFVVGGWNSLNAGLTIIFYGLACAARVWQITRDTSRLRRALTAPDVEVATIPLLGEQGAR